MAPKRKHTAATAQSPGEPDYVNPNVQWHAVVNDAVDTIKGHFGLGIVDEAALPVNQGGLMDPVDFGRLESKLTEGEEGVIIQGGINLLWGNPCQSQTPSVRINVKAIEAMSKNLWGDGKIVPLLEPVDFVAKPLVAGKPAEFERISPEEPVQALLVWVAKRIKDDADDPELNKWKAILLSTSGRFIKCDTWDARYFHSVNSRRRTADIAKTVVHLASQICQDIWLFRKRKESILNKSLSTSEVAKLYKESMPDTENDDEPRSDEVVIQKACLVYEKILSNNTISKVITWSEEIHGAGSPFNSIGKLVEIQAKLKRPASIEFFFTSMQVALMQEQMEVGDLSLKKLRGGSGKIGLLDVVAMKKGMKDFLMGRWIDLQHHISPEHKTILRKIFDTAGSYTKELLVT